MQSTVPYIDGQPVTPREGVWLAGVGLYHKGHPGTLYFNFIRIENSVTGLCYFWKGLAYKNSCKSSPKISVNFRANFEKSHFLNKKKAVDALVGICLDKNCALVPPSGHTDFNTLLQLAMSVLLKALVTFPIRCLNVDDWPINLKIMSALATSVTRKKLPNVYKS